MKWKRLKVRGNWIQSQPSKNASPTWKAIEKTKPLIAKGACYLVGNGASISVWEDPWIPWLDGFKPTPKDDSIQRNPLMVSNLIYTEDHCWNLPLLSELFNSETVEAIKKIHISLRSKADKLIWVSDSKGAFSVKSVYKANQDPPCGSSTVQWQKIWKIKAHDRIKMLLWRIGSNALPSKNNLALRLGTSDPHVCFVVVNLKQQLIYSFIAK